MMARKWVNSEEKFDCCVILMIDNLSTFTLWAPNRFGKFLPMELRVENYPLPIVISHPNDKFLDIDLHFGTWGGALCCVTR